MEFSEALSLCLQKHQRRNIKRKQLLTHKSHHLILKLSDSSLTNDLRDFISFRVYSCRYAHGVNTFDDQVGESFSPGWC